MPSTGKLHPQVTDHERSALRHGRIVMGPGRTYRLESDCPDYGASSPSAVGRRVRRAFGNEHRRRVALAPHSVRGGAFTRRGRPVEDRFGRDVL